MSDGSTDLPRHGHGDYPLYLVTVATTAACGLVVEIVAGRMLAPYLGMSIYTWTAIIAVVLAGFSAGHWVGGVMAMGPARKAERSLSWALLLAALTAVASLPLVRILAGPLITANLSPVSTIIILSSALFFLPSFFVGIPSPVLTKLAIDSVPAKTGRRLGAMYAAGAFGSIIGTLAAGFIFISWLGTIGTILTVAVIYFAFGMIFLARGFDRANWLAIWPLGLIVVLMFGIWAVGVRVQAFSSACARESQYYCIRIVDMSKQAGSEARLMVIDHLGHGMNVKNDPMRLLSSYVDLQDVLVRRHLVRGIDRFHAFFVGGGAYTLPRAWLTRFPGSRITVAEIDPAVTNLARSQMWLQPSPRLTVLHEDARRSLENLPATSKFEVIVGDAFHDIAVPQHLITREFFSTIHARLTKDGIYVMNVVDFLRRPRLLSSVVKTLSKVFKLVEVWIDDEQARSGGRATFVILAGANETQVATLKSGQFPDRQWRRIPERLLTSMSTAVKPLLLTDNFAPVDRLLAEK